MRSARRTRRACRPGAAPGCPASHSSSVSMRVSSPRNYGLARADMSQPSGRACAACACRPGCRRVGDNRSGVVPPGRPRRWRRRRWPATRRGSIQWRSAAPGPAASGARAPSPVAPVAALRRTSTSKRAIAGDGCWRFPPMTVPGRRTGWPQRVTACIDEAGIGVHQRQRRPRGEHRQQRWLSCRDPDIVLVARQHHVSGRAAASAAEKLATKPMFAGCTTSRASTPVRWARSMKSRAMSRVASVDASS